MVKVKVNIDLLMEEVWTAGKIIRSAVQQSLWGTADHMSEERKSDMTPVTVYDRHINAQFARFARNHGVGFVGEEGNGSVDQRVMLLVDPIDGTGAFALGMNTATIIVTVMAMDGIEGTPLYSIIYEPVRDIMWIGQKDHPTKIFSPKKGTRELSRLPESIPLPWKTNVCVFPHAGYRLGAVKAAVEADSRFSQQDMGAFGISAGLIASGMLHAAAIAPTSAVESAAMSLIVKGVGGIAIDLNGGSLTTFSLGKDRKGKEDFLLPHGALFASDGWVGDALFEMVVAQQDGV